MGKKAEGRKRKQNLQQRTFTLSLKPLPADIVFSTGGILQE